VDDTPWPGLKKFSSPGFFYFSGKKDNKPLSEGKQRRL
jgi:hypothetical protein